jgi:hypothetical protein
VLCDDDVEVVVSLEVGVLLLCDWLCAEAEAVDVVETDVLLLCD